MDAGRLMAAERFEAYGPSHLAVISILVVGIVVLIPVGHAHRGTAAADRFSKGFALVALALLPLQLVQLIPGRFDLTRSLPLQLCDLAWFTAVYALWSRRPWAVALTYFWGLTLSTQAVLTPDLSRDFPDLSFLTFWTMHLLVVLTPVYLTWGLGIWPTWRLYRITVVLTAVWAVAMFCLNLAIGTNYGYLNAKPARGSILDLLGPWPYYVLAEVVIVAVVWALVTWPWEALARRREATSSGVRG